MLTINSNLNALFSLRQLHASDHALAQGLRRLSSGLRINGAADDAAGLAISERMGSQVRGNGAALRNVNDGISLAQTAEAVLASVGDNLQRIRELAVQSANATNRDGDRELLQDEVAALILEIDRMAKTTKYNGARLLDGSYAGQSFQVGANTSSTDRIMLDGIMNMQVAALGGSFEYVTSVSGSFVGAPIASNQISINGIMVPASQSDGVSSYQSSASGLAFANAINSISAQTGVRAVADVSGGVFNATAAGGAFDLTVNGVAITGTTSSNAVSAADEVVAAYNARSDQTGIVASALGGGQYRVTAADGRNIQIVKNLEGGTGVFASSNTYSSLALISSDSANGMDLGGPQALVFFGTSGHLSPTITLLPSMSTIDIGSMSGATNAFAIVDRAIEQVGSARAELGALENRFAYAVSLLQTFTENLSAARSRIQDADYAQETAKLTRTMVLREAGMAMSVQANAQSSQVLALLGRFLR